MTDQEIIEAIRSNKNDKAFAALYKNFPSIRKMIRANNGLKEDAEDVFQESLIILCSKIHEGDFILTSKLGTFLYSVSRYLWMDELKRRGRRNEIVSDLNAFNYPSVDEMSMEEEYKARMAEKTIDALGERCKELLVLFYSGTLKLRDIAVKMGYTSENSAKNQKYKCLEMAKKQLKDLQQTQYSN
ncbi:MAG: polymerase, sigma-24 subunit, subfamily [Bacteroidota bacterium]|jgi:RNA polymerase sigma factor (sigma-70 family)|nr:polymerase, sigma-24 subunit, subfamily [Bacteroidota bacterium]